MLKSKIAKILPKLNSYDTTSLKVRKVADYYQFDYTSSSAPPVNFAQLLQLSELFGTQKIDVDDYRLSDGCSTCGYGEEHVKTIQIIEATKNTQELDGLIGKNLYEN